MCANFLCANCLSFRQDLLASLQRAIYFLPNCEKSFNIIQLVHSLRCVHKLSNYKLRLPPALNTSKIRLNNKDSNRYNKESRCYYTPRSLSLPYKMTLASQTRNTNYLTVSYCEKYYFGLGIEPGSLVFRRPSKS